MYRSPFTLTPEELQRYQVPETRPCRLMVLELPVGEIASSSRSPSPAQTVWRAGLTGRVGVGAETSQELGLEASSRTTVNFTMPSSAINCRGPAASWAPRPSILSIFRYTSSPSWPAPATAALTHRQAVFADLYRTRRWAMNRLDKVELRVTRDVEELTIGSGVSQTPELMRRRRVWLTRPVWSATGVPASARTDALGTSLRKVASSNDGERRRLVWRGQMTPGQQFYERWARRPAKQPSLDKESLESSW
ncbi:unnamed protein product [Protopolystoma xenopodis]|uniref:Uncharacterized protein n=1 Tax=Protopolystoma xenopodis TaxID=117903 RepID=A0A3S5APE3_9PLAT|nr:unnamed protein product [Protopolystoma xenopodis]